MVVKIPKKLEMKSLLPAPCSPLPAHVLAFPIQTLGRSSTKVVFRLWPKVSAISRLLLKAGDLGEEEFQKLAIHLLNRTPNRAEKWPKVVVHKFKENLPRTYTTEDWVECRKRKKIVIQELHELKPALGFYDVNGNMIK
jgi:hypothetical protein